MNILPQDAQNLSFLHRTFMTPADEVYPGDDYINVELPDRAEAVAALTLEKDMLLFGLGLAIDIKNMLSAEAQIDNGDLTIIITEVVSYIQPHEAATDSAYGLKCELVIEDSINICRRAVHDMLHAGRRKDANNDYLNAELVSKWVVLERIAKAIRQKDIVAASEIENEVNEPADIRINKWLKAKKRQFTSENLDQDELDIMTEHVEFRTKFMIDNYNKLSAEDKQRVDELYEIRTYLVALYNEISVVREYNLPADGYLIPESIGLTPKEAEAMVWPSKLSGLIADIDYELRKLITPMNFGISTIYSTRSDTA